MVVLVERSRHEDWAAGDTSGRAGGPACIGPGLPGQILERAVALALGERSVGPSASHDGTSEGPGAAEDRGY